MKTGPVHQWVDAGARPGGGAGR